MVKWLGLAVGLIVLIALSLSAYGAWSWDAFSQKLNKRITSAKLPSAELPYGLPYFMGLPLPVQRYFRIVLKDGQPITTGVKLIQTGTFNMNEVKPNWKPFTASQRFNNTPSGFHLGRAHPDASTHFSACSRCLCGR
jgi:hypothetical protein